MPAKVAKINSGISSVTMPAGEYYVGDPCYSVPSERWMEWLEAADYMNNERYLVAELDGYSVLGISTAHGDGVYYDERGNKYGVDAGLIGLVPVEVAAAEPVGRVKVVSFASDFDCAYKDGVITLGSISINTDEGVYES